MVMTDEHAHKADTTRTAAGLTARSSFANSEQLAPASRALCSRSRTQLDRPAGRLYVGELATMNAPPGDAVADDVSLRDLVVNLIGVAREAGAKAGQQVLEDRAIHGRLARHVYHKVGREDLGGIHGRTVVVADGPAQQRLVRVG